MQTHLDARRSDPIIPTFRPADRLDLFLLFHHSQPARRPLRIRICVVQGARFEIEEM